MHALLLAAALLIGCLLAVQTSVNLQLNKAVGTPYGASSVQLGVAALLLAVLAVTTGAIGAVRLVPDVPLWHLLGGLASPLYITSGILLFPRLGALASVGLFVTGQVFASLGLDLFGLFGLPRKPLGVGVALGALAVLAGIVVVIRGQRATPAAVRPSGRTGRVGWILLGLVAGGVLPVQGAVNARLRADLHAPLAVAVISFAVAAVTIVVVLLTLLALGRTPRPRLRPLGGMPWWGWLGGACAAAYVTATFTLIPEIGAAATVALTVTGQQAASALIDGAGLFRLPRRPLTPARLTGLALLVAGSALVQLA
ncbi:membrane protein [Sphaerisporangium krabiense]|uniref:Transporter family-2 protein n=1 Tax=Sphaerisporangium krabiense TaxID=763782 RepID=A0A7W8Z9H5_9ACTN|nr:DMT family transporter [Sphaerisporangium krabiense]MBB5629852.1 transporter family-2 protein [Sphaerisporangium krabiense]GII63953.1 membrane protein [Sphaerisporangium krabiense]